jgi:hypothetical protein
MSETTAGLPGVQGRECYVCGRQRDLQVHHVDWNHHNNARENRMVLCGRCHCEVHRDERGRRLSYGLLTELRLIVQQRRANGHRFRGEPLREGASVQSRHVGGGLSRLVDVAAR